MTQRSGNWRQDVDLPRPHRSQDDHRCPHCSKAYRTSTWLDNHIKVKHTTEKPQEQCEMVAHMSNRYHDSNLSTTVALLKQLLPIMEGLIPLLEQVDSVPSAPSVGNINLRTHKRRASSPDLLGEQGTKRRELDSGMSEVPTAGNQSEPQNHPAWTASHARTSMSNVDPHGTQHTGSMTFLPEGSRFKIYDPHYTRRVLRHPYFEQVQGSEEVLSYSSTPCSQAPSHGVPQRGHQLRLSQTPECHSQPKDMTSVPPELLGVYQLPSFPSEHISYQQEYSSNWLNPAEPLLSTTQSELDVQRLYSTEPSHHELGQNQSALQGLQRHSGPPQQITQHVLGGDLDNILGHWNFSATLDPTSTDSTMPAAQLVRNFNEGDDLDRSKGFI